MKRRIPALRERILNNWIYKTVAFAVAFAVWATTIYGQKDTILTRVMELEYILRPNFVVSNVNEKSVLVEVEGPRQILNKFVQGSNTVTLNLSNELEGEKHVGIRPSDIGVPHGLKLRSISPNEVVVRIEEVKKQ